MGSTPTPTTVHPDQRLFIGNYPEGIVYADRFVEEHGDYKRLAFLSYRTLTLELSPHVPDFLRERIEEDAAAIQARSGQQYQISGSGQSIQLGWGLPQNQHKES